MTAWWKTCCGCLQIRQPGVLLHPWKMLGALSINQKEKRKPTWQPPHMSRPWHFQCAAFIRFYSREPEGRIAGSDAVDSLLSRGGTVRWEFKSDCCTLWKITLSSSPSILWCESSFLNPALCTDVFASWMLPHLIFLILEEKRQHFTFCFHFLPLKATTKPWKTSSGMQAVLAVMCYCCSCLTL